MSLVGHKIAGIKVVNISEENAEAIEKMSSKVIQTIYQEKNKILDIQVTDDNIFFVVGSDE